eukprot:6177035-Pleurochrysis_carterae.AAC.2
MRTERTLDDPIRSRSSSRPTGLFSLSVTDRSNVTRSALCPVRVALRRRSRRAGEDCSWRGVATSDRALARPSCHERRIAS